MGAADASKVSIVGAQILPKGIMSATQGVHRSPEMMNAAEALLAAQGGPPRASLAPRPTMGDAAYQAAKAAAESAQAHPFVKPAQPVGPPVAPTTFTFNLPGPTEAAAGNGFYPPDTTGAIGPGYAVFPVNQTWNVYARSNGSLVQSGSFNAFFGTGDSLSDPRVVYDPIWKRWVVTDIVVPAPGTTDGPCFWLGASAGINPTLGFVT